MQPRLPSEWLSEIGADLSEKRCSASATASATAATATWALTVSLCKNGVQFGAKSTATLAKSTYIPNEMKRNQIFRGGYVEQGLSRSSEYRKVMKPLLERKRRARINNCLDELKIIISDLAHMETTGLNKLEKADILELAVHLLQEQRACSSSQLSGPVAHQQRLEAESYWGGFRQCAVQVSSFLQHHDKALSDQFNEFLQQILPAKPAPEPPLWRPW
ncbi:transcription factor HES-2 [Drosophila miranda]|uniref:transcription factor HES-2 n=1 Tax=Drosophila miranda TaxID=7229 RepID=UPI00143F323D|nr:transcription factor HES-2 [Drosophila miranda]